jgi:hypothetical protein
MSVALAACVPSPEPARTPASTQATQAPGSGATAAETNGVEIANHDRPQLSLSFQPLLDAGCTAAEDGRWTCPPDGAVAALGCRELAEPSDLLGGLDPALVLLECVVDSDPQAEAAQGGSAGESEPQDYVYSVGCLRRSFVWYVVWREGRFELIKTGAGLGSAVAPVTSVDEALSLALAVTGLEAYYGLAYQPGTRYLTERLEDTDVAETGNGGYAVHLFYYQFCGCGPHTTSAVDVMVEADGQVTLEGRTPQFENPEEDGLCVD